MKGAIPQVSGKIIAGILLLLLLGLPIVETWRMIVLVVGLIALIHSDVLLEKRRMLWVMGIVIPVLIIKSILPAAGIEEGHNIFLYLREGETLQRTLPPDVFNEWRQEFDKVYPPVQPYREPYVWRTVTFRYEPYTWRDIVFRRNALPDRAYTYSSDSLWRPARYSRKVDTISFRNLSEFRGGFANEFKYGEWFRGAPDRRRMPFFVMYEFSGPVVGSILNWRGTLFWEGDNGGFERIIHKELEGKTISPIDIGRKAYILFIPDVTPQFPVNLKLSGKLSASRFAGNALSIIGIVSLFVMLTRIRWRPFLTASSIVAIAIALIYLSIAVSGGKPLGALYPPHGGGDDGVIHEAWGRDMARLTFHGEIKEALRGFESIYWYTPGMRYARAVEKIFFGDTNLGLTAFLACMPWFIYLLLYHLCGLRWALAGTGVFLLSPVSFSFAQYIFCGMLGYAEPISSGLIFAGLFLFMKSQPRWGGIANPWFAFIGGACLAGAIFLRPNNAIAAAAAGLFFLYASLRDHEYRIMFSAIAGLGLALCMTLHNYFYGHEFYLISQSGAAVSMPVSPLTYFAAAREFISGQWQGMQLAEATNQIKGWLWTPPPTQFPLQTGMGLFLFLRIVTLLATLAALLVPFRRAPRLVLLAWIALAAHLPMLFVFETKLRYGLLGWDISAIVTMMLAAYIFVNRKAGITWKTAS